jgi:hypothetical protein
MKSTELRIGNWVWNDTQQIPVEVDLTILSEQIYREAAVRNGSLSESSLWLPIPLTEEWLLKFGFVENTTSWTRWRKPIGVKEIRLTKNGVNRITYNGMRMNHIHQLQNLYHALTHQEL